LKVAEPSGIALTKKELPVWRKVMPRAVGAAMLRVEWMSQVIEVIGETKGLGDVRLSIGSHKVGTGRERDS